MFGIEIVVCGWLVFFDDIGEKYGYSFECMIDEWCGIDGWRLL